MSGGSAETRFLCTRSHPDEPFRGCVEHGKDMGARARGDPVEGVRLQELSAVCLRYSPGGPKPHRRHSGFRFPDDAPASEARISTASSMNFGVASDLRMDALTAYALDKSCLA